jgi:hypothetical protein
MKCLLWFKEKKNREPKLYLKLNGKREEMSIALEALLEGLCMQVLK